MEPRSEYRGVCWDKKASKWRAQIVVDGANQHVGMFVDEEGAAQAYDGAARNSSRPDWLSLLNFPTAAEQKQLDSATAAEKKRSAANTAAAGCSDYRGVGWYKRDCKWVALITVDGAKKQLGTFDDEEEAARAFDGAARNSSRPDWLSLLNFPTAAEQKQLDSATAAEKKRSAANTAAAGRSDYRGVGWYKRDCKCFNRENHLYVTHVRPC